VRVQTDPVDASPLVAMDCPHNAASMSCLVKQAVSFVKLCTYGCTTAISGMLSIFTNKSRSFASTNPALKKGEGILTLLK
jgi:hypothetical protein